MSPVALPTTRSSHRSGTARCGKAAAIAEMTSTLKHLVNNCHGDHRPDCPIIEGFAEGKGKVDATPAKEGRKFGVAAV